MQVTSTEVQHPWKAINLPRSTYECFNESNHDLRNGNVDYAMNRYGKNPVGDGNITIPINMQGNLTSPTEYNLANVLP